MLIQQKQQHIVYLTNFGTLKLDLNFLKHSGDSSHAREVFWNPNFCHKPSD